MGSQDMEPLRKCVFLVMTFLGTLRTVGDRETELGGRRAVICGDISENFGFPLYEIQLQNGETVTEARYRIDITGRVDGFTNVALGKPASMNGYREGNPPSAAVDGDNTTFIHPPNGPMAPVSWWEVDLLGTYYIVSVSITNRECCDYRLRNFTIDLISDDLSAIPTTRLCHFYPGSIGKYVTEVIACDDLLTAQKVRVTKKGHLDFSEVSIKALPACGGLQFTLNPGIRRLDTALRQLVVDSTTMCAIHCREEIDCDAFQTLTSATNVTCQLLVGQNGNTVADNNWKYYHFAV